MSNYHPLSLISHTCMPMFVVIQISSVIALAGNRPPDLSQPLLPSQRHNLSQPLSPSQHQNLSQPLLPSQHHNLSAYFSAPNVYLAYPSHTKRTLPHPFIFPYSCCPATFISTPSPLRLISYFVLSTLVPCLFPRTSLHSITLLTTCKPISLLSLKPGTVPLQHLQN